MAEIAFQQAAVRRHPTSSSSRSAAVILVSLVLASLAASARAASWQSTSSHALEFAADCCGTVRAIATSQPQGTNMTTANGTVASSQVILVPLDQFVLEDQPRTNAESSGLAELAESMVATGQLQPVCARRRPDGRLDLVDGLRRVLAAPLADMKCIRTVVLAEGDGPTSALLAQQAASNMARVDWPPIDKATAIRRLMVEKGLTLARAAKVVGISESMASKLLSLLKLPEKMQQQIARGEITISNGYEISRIKDKATRDRVATSVVAARVSRDRLSRKIAKVHRRDRDLKDGKCVVMLQGGCSVTIRGTRRITMSQFADLLDELLVRVRRAVEGGVALAAFLKADSKEKHS